jgi:hypothetical protein
MGNQAGSLVNSNLAPSNRNRRRFAIPSLADPLKFEVMNTEMSVIRPRPCAFSPKLQTSRHGFAQLPYPETIRVLGEVDCERRMG